MISFSPVLFWPLAGIFLGRTVLGGSGFKTWPLEGCTEANASDPVCVVVLIMLMGCVGHSAAEAGLRTFLSGGLWT